jgi:hypothetical protein
MAEFGTNEGAMLGDILRKLIQRGTGQSEAIGRTAEREKLVAGGASPADIFASEEARREQALSRQNVLGGIGAQFPGLAKAPIIGGVFSPGEPLPAPARTQEELTRASNERRAEESNVRAEEQAGRTKELHPLVMGKTKAETQKALLQKQQDALKHIPAETAQQILAAQPAESDITPDVIQAAIGKRREYEATLAAARKVEGVPERRAKVELKKQSGKVTRASAALKAAQTSYDKLPTPENQSKIEAAKKDLLDAVSAAESASDMLKGSIGGVQTSPQAPAPAGQAAVAPATAAAGKIVVEKDGKRFNLPAAQLDEAMKQGYKQVK